MKITARNGFVILSLLSLLLAFGCKNKTSEADERKLKVLRHKDYLSLIISLDTLSSKEFRKKIIKEDSVLNTMPDKGNNPYHYYFKARRLGFEKKRDSAFITYKKMKGQHPNDEVELLRKEAVLDKSINNGTMVELALMNELYSTMQTAERVQSKITYRYYDLLAKAYFQNNNEKKSLAYAAKYFESHPFKWHRVIKQRYFDISFLLAARLGDIKKMSYYNNQARMLARQISDSLCIARTYDNEAQIYSLEGQTAKSLASSKVYFNFLKQANNLNAIAYNNLATSFVRNRQPDSAIYYYKQGIAFEKTESGGKQLDVHYKGLIDAYKLKGDYRHALDAADSAYKIEIRNNKAIEAVKVAEMHEKYETEQKDRNIAELHGRNELNETIIKQQRWGIFLVLLISLGVLLFFFIIYHQQRLRERNKLLKSENQRLNMEQKLLQAQLNPHFIFNAIANLQSLVASGHIDESVRYLKSFSGLLRSILEQNRKDFIEIEEEVTSLNNYIQLQQMRYTDAFDYKINVDNQLDLNDTLIPPMLIQPFVENAIEHGFRNISYKGMLNISFSVVNNKLQIIIDDNGSGLKPNVSDKQKKQSLAQIILKERFDLLFTAKGQEAHFKVTDKKETGASGVQVEIKIPIINE